MSPMKKSQKKRSKKKLRGFPRRSATSELKKSREFVDETVFRITDSRVKFLGWYTLREYIDCVESGFQRIIPRVIHFASDTIPTLLFYDAKIHPVNHLCNRTLPSRIIGSRQIYPSTLSRSSQYICYRPNASRHQMHMGATKCIWRGL